MQFLKISLMKVHDMNYMLIVDLMLLQYMRIKMMEAEKLSKHLPVPAADLMVTIHHREPSILLKHIGGEG